MQVCILNLNWEVFFKIESISNEMSNIYVLVEKIKYIKLNEN